MWWVHLTFSWPKEQKQTRHNQTVSLHFGNYWLTLYGFKLTCSKINYCNYLHAAHDQIAQINGSEWEQDIKHQDQLLPCSLLLLSKQWTRSSAKLSSIAAPNQSPQTKLWQGSSSVTGRHPSAFWGFEAHRTLHNSIMKSQLTNL